MGGLLGMAIGFLTARIGNYRIPLALAAGAAVVLARCCCWRFIGGCGGAAPPHIIEHAGLHPKK